MVEGARARHGECERGCGGEARRGDDPREDAEQPGEECDAVGESAVCNEDCTLAACGDGVLNASAGEACDDGVATARCDGDCMPPACGDGVLNPGAGEACDDGNTAPGDACSTSCASTFYLALAVADRVGVSEPEVADGVLTPAADLAARLEDAGVVRAHRQLALARSMGSARRRPGDDEPRKPASQSSTYGVAWAFLAVDGNRDGNYNHGSVMHTNNVGENWWQVDLEAVEPIGEIVIWNRTDCCGERLRDFAVSVSNDLVHPRADQDCLGLGCNAT